MDENNNNVNSNDNVINDGKNSYQTEEEGNKSFDIRSFNSYGKGTETEAPKATNAYPSVGNVPLVPTGEGTFYTPEPAPAPEESAEPLPPPPTPADPAVVAREYKKAARRRFSYVAFMMIAMYFVSSVVVTIAMIAYYIITGEEEISTTASMVIGSLATALVDLPFMALTLSKIKTMKMPKMKISFAKLLSYLTITFMAMYVGAFIGSCFGGILGEIFGNPGEEIVSGSLEGVPIWLICIFTCVFPGIFEELIFRKLIIDKTKDFGLFASVIFSGFTFGIYHGNFEQFFYALLVGLFFAYIYAKTGRIIYSIILHITMNFFGSVLGILVENNETAITIYSLILMAMFVAGIVALVIEIVDNYKKLKNDRGVQTVGSGDAVLSMILNPGMIVFLVLFAVVFAYMTVLTYGG